MSRYVTVYNLKGGSSKTSSTFQLASLMSKDKLDANGNVIREGKKILIIDMDEQINMTKRMTGTNDNPNPINRLIVDDLFIEEGIIKPLEEYPNLYLIPGSKGLNVLDKHLSKQRAEEHVIRKYLEKNKDELNNYDYIFFDMSPTSSIVNLNIFVAITKFGGSFIIPLFYRMTDSMSGAEDFLKMYEQDMDELEMEGRANICTMINGYRVTKTKANNTFESRLSSEYQGLEDILLDTKINDSDVVVNAMEQMLSTRDYIKKNRISNTAIAEQFDNLVDELIAKEVL